MARGEARTKEAARQVAMVCLDELVPADDHFRRILDRARRLDRLGRLLHEFRIRAVAGQSSLKP